MDFLFNLLTTIFLVFSALLVLTVMFANARSLGGWTFPQALGLYGVFLFFEEVAVEILPGNIGKLPQDVKSGDLDFVLLKPLDSLFQLSVRRMPLTSLPTLMLSLGIVAYAAAGLGTLTIANTLIFLALMLCGLIIIVALNTILLTTAFWFVRVENIPEIFHAAFTAGRFPVTAFPIWLRVILTTVVPIAFITTVPASAAVGKLDPWMALAAPVVAIAMLAAARAFWGFALRHYTSASS